MSKYIVDIDDFEPHFKVDSIGVFGIGKSLSYSEEDHSWSRIKSIEGFEELNSDYINEHYGELQDEAYQRGHDDGYEAGCATAFKPVSDAEYQRGLDDAMSAFKKLYSCGWERDWKAMGFEFDEGEWSTSFEFIIGHYTAAEIVEKVKAYEKSTKHFGVGDFVSHNNKPEITVLVTYVSRDTFNGIAVADVEGHCHIGEAYSCCAFENWHKVNAQFVKGEDNA